MNCLKKPIPEIFEAAELLKQAVDAHYTGNQKLAEKLIIEADNPMIREWTESIWGTNGIYSSLKNKIGDAKMVPNEMRDSLRMPNKSTQIELLQRDGFYCRFCRIPVIRKEVREHFKKIYPKAMTWGKTNQSQHAAFQAMWLQFDHIVPHARGGKTTHENMVITCAPCNYGRMNFLLEEIGISLAEIQVPSLEEWDGLERFLK